MIRPNIVLRTDQNQCIITCNEEFRYPRYIPKKRIKKKETLKAVFIQRNIPCFVTGEIEFKGKVFKSTADCLFAMNRECDTIELRGQYGEILGVELMDLKIKDGYSLSEISGKFLVLCEIKESDPIC